MARRSGKDGQVWLWYASLSGASYSLLGVTRWTGDEEAEDLDATGMDSGGYSETETGILTMNVNVEANYDDSQNPAGMAYPNPPAVRAGMSVWVRLVQTDSKELYGTLKILRVNRTNPVKGLITYNFSGKLSGTYSWA